MYLVDLSTSGGSSPSPSPETNIHHQVEYLMRLLVLIKLVQHVKFEFLISFNCLYGPKKQECNPK